MTRPIHIKPIGRKREIATIAFGALIIISTAWYSHSRPSQATRKIGAVSGTAACAIDSFPALPVTSWVGKQFIALVKPKMFWKFGYELYLTKELSGLAGKIDTSKETDRHHIRYDKIAGKTLTVTQVIPAAAGEFLVVFSVKDQGLTLYGKTHKLAIEGLVLADDLAKASGMWVGRTVYSRQRLINTYDTATQSFAPVKVPIQEKLTVTGARFGTSPLPPKPIWLIVTTGSGLSGLIPICMSWTNVMTDKKTSGAPWAEDLFETNPLTLYSWDSLTWKAINSHTIISGMTKEMVRVSWGTPQRSVIDTTKAQCTEQWIFGGQYICFQKDTVTSVGAR